MTIEWLVGKEAMEAKMRAWFAKFGSSSAYPAAVETCFDLWRLETR